VLIVPDDAGVVSGVPIDDGPRPIPGLGIDEDDLEGRLLPEQAVEERR